ncbi:dimethylarginine dimethylaminohydrolase [Salinibacterium sp. G-O1]|uniref:dimethylargininase n=1 Tax=Salinibacterium sp. G-O1 TaxID=3046208 RepID=UPI0024BA78A9|nr:dimethylargininase [Salinibacterium sp. G-O1]MDJ0334235.1 dimethylarginine dimethylaminohydrolase [Salinibacterium sp. G-O1]
MHLSALNRPLPTGRKIAAAVISGFVVAAVTHLVSVLVFFVSNGAASANIVPISDYFVPSSLLLFVLYSVAAFLGANRMWPIALGAGLVSGMAAAFLGTLYAVAVAGPLSAEAVGFVAASLLGSNLLYFVVAGVVAATAGRFAWAATVSSRSHRVAFIRQPASNLADGEITHIDRTELDETLADTQWDNYVEALVNAGFETVELPAADEHPDSVFVEDAVVVLGGTAIITRPGAESRRGETDAVRPAARKAGLTVREIVEPGTLDGGDVLVVDSTIYVGRGGRTNAEGIRQFRAFATKLGYTVVAVPVTKVLHLKSAVTALPDGTVVGYLKHVDKPQLFPRFLALPEPGAAVVVLSDDTVMMATSVPKSIALIEDLGYTVVAVDVSEFEKLEGCVTCLSVRLG